MANRAIHYEAAFEEYLRARRIPYVCVDEAKRTLFANAQLKSFDFVVYPVGKPLRLLLDIKGRSCRDRSRRTGFESWVTEGDVIDLLQWEQVFGDGFEAVLGFTYWIEPPLTMEPGMFEFRERWYLFMGVQVREYRDHMRRRSAKWGTVCLKTDDFRALARPIEEWL